MTVTEGGRMALTGNPFVDTGLAVLASLAGLEDVRELTVEAVKQVHGDGSTIAGWNSRLKSFTMIFTKNSLLSNPAIKDAGKRALIYRAVLSGLAAKIGDEEISCRCEACGNRRSLDLGALCRGQLGETRNKGQSRVVGRDWFPLSGSLGSEAQALPAASRPVHLCAKCLFAVHYLPLGLLLLEGSLAVFQCSSIDFWYELVRDIFSEVHSRVTAGIYETIGAKEGSRAFIRRLMGLFEKLQSSSRFGDIPAGAALQTWRFANSGTPPRNGITCRIDEIPNCALVFLWKAVRHGLREEVEALMSRERKMERPLFRCIAAGRDYRGLYPSAKWAGAKPKLFGLYQTEVCGRSWRALGIAQTLACEGMKGLSAKEKRRRQREEAFSEAGLRNRFRGLMASLAEEGKLTLGDYLGLFPLGDDESGIAVRWDGWDLIRYYVHYPEVSGVPPRDPGGESLKPLKVAQLRYYAACIFKDYTEERGGQRFQSEVLGRMRRGELGAPWVNLQFVRLAEVRSGFTYRAWERLCKDDRGWVSVREMLFQMRLLWSEWIGGGRLPTSDAPEFEEDLGLPGMVEDCLKEVFSQYVRDRGLGRFHRNVLLRLRRKEIGLGWFRRLLAESEKEMSGCKLMSGEDWDAFLRDRDGRSCAGERLFQMSLMLANLYRAAAQAAAKEDSNERR